jgi:fatty-acyl-CoA synthase
MRDKQKDELCKQEYAKISNDQFMDGLFTRMAGYIDFYAYKRPDDLALIEYNTGEEITWKDFALKTKAFSAKLLDMGLKKGDIVATMLPLLKEHVFLMYACYRIGVIIAPLDLRLKGHELKRCFAQIKPKAFFFLGKTTVTDFRPLVAEVMEDESISDQCKYWIQFDFFPHLIMKGAISIREFAQDVQQTYIASLFSGSVKKAMTKVHRRDPCLIIFTTGSTGFPKPALICHENILTQAIGIKIAFEITEKDRMCVNLPPSHVGCVTEQLATTIFAGGVCVLLHIFDAEKTLDAIQKYDVTAFGQIPALFNMQWRLDSYKKYNLSTLRFALYGGQAVTKEFLEKLATMAPKFGTGLGLTETAGFVTYTPLDGTVEDILSSVGFDSPLCPISIREPMKSDDSAGNEKPKGEMGEVCFSGSQIFLGYMNDEENTRKTVSKDGYCYTGDLGFYDEKGLHFSGRSKFVIKPKGYQVFPAEIENFISDKLEDKIEYIGCIGVPHKIYSEAIVLFVAKKEGTSLSSEEIYKVSKDIAAYKRPSHIVFLEVDDFPLNRVAKTDYKILKELASEEIEKLKGKGTWDG